MSIQILGADGVTVLTAINVGGAVGAVPAVSVRRDGSDIDPVYLGKYYISFTQRFTVGLSANSPYFAMRNGGTRNIKFLEMQGEISFDGTTSTSQLTAVGQKTTAASTTLAGGIALGGATGLLGAPAFAVVPESAASAVTTLADARYATAGAALTSAGIVATSPIFSLTLSRGVSAASSILAWPRDLELAPGEGLVISSASAGAPGDAIAFTLFWGEK